MNTAKFYIMKKCFCEWKTIKTFIKYISSWNIPPLVWFLMSAYKTVLNNYTPCLHPSPNKIVQFINNYILSPIQSNFFQQIYFLKVRVRSPYKRNPKQFHKRFQMRLPINASTIIQFKSLISGLYFPADFTFDYYN